MLAERGRDIAEPRQDAVRKGRSDDGPRTMDHIGKADCVSFCRLPYALSRSLRDVARAPNYTDR